MLGVYRTDVRGPINAKHLLVEIPRVAIPVNDTGRARTSTAAHAHTQLRGKLLEFAALQRVRTSSA
jgi:hypothetical protein